MGIYESHQWISDIDEAIASLPELSELEGQSVLITGAAGLICSTIVDIILRYNDTHYVPIRIVAAGRKLKKIAARFGDMAARTDFIFVTYDASRPDNCLDVRADYIIHGASPAYPSAIMKEPVETMLSNFSGMKYLLDYARENAVKRVLYISSSEIYGQKEGHEPYREGQYGYIDLLNPRNSYSVGKRAAETLCASYCAEYGVESVIVRPGHIYGPTASSRDNRVSSAWAYAAARGEDIVIKSDGLQLRSYCYCPDAASAILKVLLRGESTTAYNISNPGSIITIRQLGEILAKAGRVKLRMEPGADIDKKAFNPMDNSSLDSTALMSLGWKGLFDAERGLSHTVNILRETEGAQGRQQNNRQSSP